MSVKSLTRKQYLQKIKDLRGEDSAEYRIAKEAMGMVWNGLLQHIKGFDIMAVRGKG